MQICFPESDLTLLLFFTVFLESPQTIAEDDDARRGHAGASLRHENSRNIPHSRGFVRQATGPVPAMKSEATAIFAPQDGRWKITVSFDGRRFCVPKFRH